MNGKLLVLGLGVIDQPLGWDSLTTRMPVVITLAHAYAPFAILPIFVALEKIDRSVFWRPRAIWARARGHRPFLRVTLR